MVWCGVVWCGVVRRPRVTPSGTVCPGSGGALRVRARAGDRGDDGVLEFLRSGVPRLVGQPPPQHALAKDWEGRCGALYFGMNDTHPKGAHTRNAPLSTDAQRHNSSRTRDQLMNTRTLALALALTGTRTLTPPHRFPQELGPERVLLREARELDEIQHVPVHREGAAAHLLG